MGKQFPELFISKMSTSASVKALRGHRSWSDAHSWVSPGSVTQGMVPSLSEPLSLQLYNQNDVNDTYPKVMIGKIYDDQKNTGLSHSRGSMTVIYDVILSTLISKYYSTTKSTSTETLGTIQCFFENPRKVCGFFTQHSRPEAWQRVNRYLGAEIQLCAQCGTASSKRRVPFPHFHKSMDQLTDGPSSGSSKLALMCGSWKCHSVAFSNNKVLDEQFHCNWSPPPIFVLLMVCRTVVRDSLSPHRHHTIKQHIRDNYLQHRLIEYFSKCFMDCRCFIRILHSFSSHSLML